MVLAFTGIMLFWLLVGHALADYPLQGAFLSQAKRKGAVKEMPWQLALAVHSLIHGAFVALVTGSVLLGTFETVAHAVIDYQKCQKRIGMWMDQALHVACKLLWIGLILFGGF